MKSFIKLLAVGAAGIMLLQFVRPAIPSLPATAELQAPPQVMHILEKDCYSCHSNQRRLAWFDEVVPPYWLVRHDVLTAREHLNFSTIGSKPAAVQKAALYEAVNMIQLGAMPLPQFLKLHPEAAVTPDELAVLKAYLAPWPNPPATDTAEQSTAGAAALNEPSISLAAVRPEWNGIQFDPSFENWKLIAITDRGDNNSFRMILGNEVAVNAAQSGHISPWPDGTRLAKIAWQQEIGADGLLHPGKFIQVELMLKDAHVYKSNDGWGWGRWRGLDLKPYGKDAAFVNECTGCHQPLRGNDYVYTLPISAAKITGLEVVNNLAAQLPNSLPHQPLGWYPIAMYVDPVAHTTATLYGNDSAIRAVRREKHSQRPLEYPPGAVLALVAWAQRDDPHWFGARIPAAPQSIEFVTIGNDPGTSSYRSFAGESLVENHSSTREVTDRMQFILGLHPAELP